MIGQTVSHYRVVERLGGGGMGVVYRAEDTKLRRSVALKVLPPDLTRDDDAKRRFILEAQAASALDHPNICTIHEIGESPDGQLFLVLAYYDGETLKKKIERGPLKLDEALDFGVQIAQGLVKAHAALWSWRSEISGKIRGYVSATCHSKGPPAASPLCSIGAPWRVRCRTGSNTDRRQRSTSSN